MQHNHCAATVTATECCRGSNPWRVARSVLQGVLCGSAANPVSLRCVGVPLAFKQQTLNCAQPLSFTHYAHTHARERTHCQLTAVSTSTAASLSATAGRWPPASASGPAPATCQPPTSCPTRPWIAQQPRGYCCLGPGSGGEHRVASERAQMPGCGRRVTTSRAPRTAAPIRSFCHAKRWSGLQLNSRMRVRVRVCGWSWRAHMLVVLLLFVHRHPWG